MSVQRVESQGSWWLIDEDARRYCRFPKNEGGRERAEWGDENAGLLRDAVWHDFTGRWRYDARGLFIETEEPGPDGKSRGVKAPPTWQRLVEDLWMNDPAGER